MGIWYKGKKIMILNIILRLIHTQEILGYAPKADSRLREDLNLTFLDLVELQIDIEREFNIKLSDTDLKEIKTVADLVELVKYKLKHKGD